MNLREITVGRSKACDIFLDPRCQYASNQHGVIYYDGTQLMFRDTSTNGTLINNVSVHWRAVPIYRGDAIMLAGKYPLSWKQIDVFFPPGTEPGGPTMVGLAAPFPRETGQSTPPAELTPDTTKWNWGAFGLYPIWGFFNGCWWGILISIAFGWLWPLPNILFGALGSRWAWKNKRWASPLDFTQAQAKWMPWGIVCFCLGLVSWLFYLTAFLSVL